MHDPVCLSVALLPLEYWCASLSSSFEDLSFAVCSTALSESPKCLLCSPSTLHNHPPAALVFRARIIVSQCGNYEFQVLLRTKDKGTMTCEDELHHLCGMLSKPVATNFVLDWIKLSTMINMLVSFDTTPRVFDSCPSHSAVWIPHDVSYGISWPRIVAYLKGTWKKYCASPARRW